jgi:uncharacterized protein (TIGR00725 family)
VTPTSRRRRQDPDVRPRPFRIAVCGAGEAAPSHIGAAEAVGAAIARQGGILVCGGLGGVMEAAARGAAAAGGLTVGVLPGADASNANAWIGLPLPTGMGEGRNVLVVRFAEAVIAIGGEWGTLSEIALARKIGVPVVLLEPTLGAALDLPHADSPDDAVDRAIRFAREGRRS